MKANKRVRDLRRRSEVRLTTVIEGSVMGTTTFPLLKKDKDGKQKRLKEIKIQWN